MRKISLASARWQKLKRLLYCRHSWVASTGLKELCKLEQANQMAREKCVVFLFVCFLIYTFYFREKKTKITLFFIAAQHPLGFTFSFMKTRTILSSLVDQLRYTYKPDRIHVNWLSSKDLLSAPLNLI